MRSWGTWLEISLRAGLILEAGNAAEYETGDWRTQRPIWHEGRCIQCYRCWVYCPDGAIVIKDGKVSGIDYVHCKGCGVCVSECPTKDPALELITESEAIES